MVSRFQAALLATFAALLTPAAARSDTVDVYAAGSLRGVMSALAPKALAMGITLQPSFGGSGELRDRIDRGAKPDLLLSADMTSPRGLADGGRTVVPAIAFARNRLCLVARRALNLTPETFVTRLLRPDVRIRTSKPIADPSGDYAMAMFDLIDAARPGAGKALRAKADAQMAASAPATIPGQNATAALFAAQRIDVAVTYCSASADLAKAAPGLTSIAVPAAFDPKPVFGIALLTAKPAALRLALLLLSDAGQAALTSAGLIPLADGGRP